MAEPLHSAARNAGHDGAQLSADLRGTACGRRRARRAVSASPAQRW
ncbi:MAG: hypothetical protein ACI3VX_04040 [Faecousia sp.]